MARILSKAAWIGAWLALLVACATPPHLPRDDGAARGPTPGLLPLADVLLRAGPGVHAALATRDDTARVRALNARAQALRRPVMTAHDRARMLRMLARHR